ncbi:hypothetical protein AGMMS49944_00590 [Spirochaetia bacterium]|nr:hypothetical protein AGMMS49944_00590 [Spirochaetia bacterium]
MGNSTDWLSQIREKILEMAKNFIAFIGLNGTRLGIPTTESDVLATDTTAAEAALTAATGIGRGPANTALCNTAFTTLKKKLRSIKERYFIVPPMTNDELISLGLKPKDDIHTKKNPPQGMFTARVLSALNGLAQYVIEPVEEAPPDALSLIDGYDAYRGIMPQGGATLEQAAGPKHYLQNMPVTGSGLQLLESVSRKRNKMSFDAEDRGMTSCISFRAKNGKENLGPWGPVVSFIIP